MSEGGKKAKQMASSSHLRDRGFDDQDFGGDSSGDDENSVCNEGNNEAM